MAKSKRGAWYPICQYLAFRYQRGAQCLKARLLNQLPPSGAETSLQGVSSGAARPTGVLSSVDRLSGFLNAQPPAVHMHVLPPPLNPPATNHKNHLQNAQPTTRFSAGLARPSRRTCITWPISASQDRRLCSQPLHLETQAAARGGSASPD